MRVEGWIQDIPELDAAERSEWISEWKERFYARFKTTSHAVALGPYGKPGWKEPAAGKPAFNFSHTDHWIVAVTAQADVGVDLEETDHPRFRDTARLANLVDRYFHADEIRAWKELSPETRALAFVTAWTQKEAASKALGRGLGVGAKNVRVVLHPHAPTHSTDIAWEGQISRYRVRSFTHRNAILSVALKQRESQADGSVQVFVPENADIDLLLHPLEESES